MQWLGIDLKWTYDHLLPVIFQRTHDRSSAYDVLHDALLRYALMPRPERIKQPHAYLRSVVNSVIVDNHRDMAHFVPIIAKDAEYFYQTGTELDPLTSERFAPSAEHLADLQQRLTALQTIIVALPKKCREVFWLYRIEGHSQRQIAERLGISLKTVEAHMARAMVDLSDMCAQFLD